MEDRIELLASLVGLEDGFVPLGETSFFDDPLSNRISFSSLLRIPEMIEMDRHWTELSSTMRRKTRQDRSEIETEIGCDASGSSAVVDEAVRSLDDQCEDIRSATPESERSLFMASRSATRGVQCVYARCVR